MPPPSFGSSVIVLKNFCPFILTHFELFELWGCLNEDPAKNARKSSIRIQSRAIRIFLGEDLIRPRNLLEKPTKKRKKKYGKK